MDSGQRTRNNGISFDARSPIVCQLFEGPLAER